MSRSERGVLEAMDRAVMDPPSMSLSPDSVVALGRSKVRRRRAAGAGMSIAAAAVAVTAWVGLSSDVDLLGDQIAPADEAPVSLAELQLEMADGRLQVSDGVGLDTTIALNDLEGGWTAPGPEGTTYVVDRDWPQDTRTFALVRDPATGITTVSPVKTVPDAPTGYVGATVPAGPTGAPLDVISLSALVGEPSECNLHAPEAYPVTPGGGPSGQVAAVQLLADDRHWTGCVVGDVFAGDLQEPTAQWRGNAMVPVGSWQDGFPDGIVTVLPDESRWTEGSLVPVWEGEPAFELDQPVAMPAGVGRAMALDWSLPLERLGQGDTEGLLGFDATGDGKVDIPLLPLGTNRALTDGRLLAAVAGRQASTETLSNPLTGRGLGLDDLEPTRDVALPDSAGVRVVGWEPSALSPTPYDIGRLLVETDSGIELIRPEAVRIVRGEAAEYVLAVQEATLDGGDLLTAVVVLGDSGPMLVGGAEPALTQASPPVWVAVAPGQDLWVATDDGIPSAGRLSDGDLPFETDADGMPVPVGRR